MAAKKVAKVEVDPRYLAALEQVETLFRGLAEGTLIPIDAFKDAKKALAEVDKYDPAT